MYYFVMRKINKKTLKNDILQFLPHNSSCNFTFIYRISNFRDQAHMFF